VKGPLKPYERVVTVWNLDTGKEAASLPLLPGDGWFNGLSWTTDGKALLISSATGQLWRWDPTGREPFVTGESIASDPTGAAGERNARSVAIHRDAALCAFAIIGKLPKRITRRNLDDDYDDLPPPEIVLWEIKTMQRRATFSGHRGQINHIAFSPDGRSLVSGGSDGTVRIWTLTSAQGG
jgi:WD40 repeat protein